MYPGLVHRMNQAKKGAEQQQQQQQTPPQQAAYVIQQQQQQASYVIQQQQQPMGMGQIGQPSPQTAQQVLLFSVKAKKLKAADWNGKSDPYLEFYRLERNGWTKVHTTPVQYKTLKPIWTGLSIPLHALCYADRNRPILLRCLDYDEGQAPDHLGDCQLTVQDLLKAGKFKVELKSATQSASILARSMGHLTFFNVSIVAAPNNIVVGSPQAQQRSPQAAAVIYSAAGAAPASVQAAAYGPAPPPAAQPAYGLAAQGYVPSQPPLVVFGQHPYIGGNQAPVVQPPAVGYYPGTAASARAGTTTSGIPMGSSSPVYPAAAAAAAVSPVGQHVYSSHLPTPSSSSSSRPACSAASFDDEPPPPSYDELYPKYR